MAIIDNLGQNAKKASFLLAQLGTEAKNTALLKVAEALLAELPYILEENVKDVALAQEHGISAIMVDRLRLDEKRLQDIASGVRDVAALGDPIGQVVRGYTNMDGLKIIQKRVPLGVIAMIFESRPNVWSM